VLSEHRPVLLGYALLQLRDNALADDAVLDTLLAAWQTSSNFEGKAGLRTWLIGILKHKIADHWRRNIREVSTPEFDHIIDHDSDTDEDEFFTSNGQWHSGPSAWNDPEAARKQQEFWTIYEAGHNNS